MNTMDEEGSFVEEAALFEPGERRCAVSDL